MGYNTINPEPEKDRHAVASRGTSRLEKADKRIYDTPTGLPYDQDPEKDNDFVTESNVASTPDLPTILVRGYPSGSSQIKGGVVTENGLVEVFHDDTLTGNGTEASPLSVVPVTATAEWGYITGSIVNQADLYETFDRKANLASPHLTGDPRAPTQDIAISDDTIATTAFVSAKLASYNPSITHGSWIPSLSGGAEYTLGIDSATWTKVGQEVTLSLSSRFDITTPGTGIFYVQGIPSNIYPSETLNPINVSGTIGNIDGVNAYSYGIILNTQTKYIMLTAAAFGQMSWESVYTNSGYIGFHFQIKYFVDI